MTSLHYFYIALSLLIWIAGYLHTGRFVRPKWKIPGKFVFYVAVSTALVYFAGHYALIFIVGHPLLGLLFHIRACKKYDIDWKTCRPRERYVELQEKWARGEFG